ncbi:TniB family NTP-binding protein [Aminobacter anthyllidis]|uniref:TniB family NTP-binding protein n=1 Tax=Aminobacter anthyllidis TaxID=1035067 RepID=A0A9X1D7T1_9HYPH|nr:MULTISPECIES: TniB family NTP-binding protein [Phyllobacteriaceae]MBT1160260.1 TniB family NTP-binding protein [Aminobacter anthyllidis]BCG75969.1 transposition protein TniB [Mesorhizobium sp. 113-1-2]
MTAYPHLDPAVQAHADLPDRERIEHIRVDRWIDYPRARQALDKLEELLLFPKRARMPNLLIFGASGMGKTMIIEKFVRAHPPSFDESSGIDHRPVIVVQMVASPHEGRFYHRLLSVIGAPPPTRATLGQLETQALRLLQEIAPRMLIIDEVQNLIAGTYREQRRMLNLLRFLGNELRIPLICLGSHEARDAVRGDAHLNSRFEPYGLPPWRHDADFQGLIGGLLWSLPLRLPSELTDSALKRLVDVNGGVTSSIFRMVIDLATDAILTGTERITPAAILDHRVAAPATVAAA